MTMEEGLAYVSESPARDPLQSWGPKEEGEGVVVTLLSPLPGLFSSLSSRQRLQFRYRDFYTTQGSGRVL